MILSVITIGLANSVSATTNDTDDINKPLYRQIQDLIVNPNFAPDYTCLFDAYQLHCIPGENQDCYDIEGFAQNEDGTCFAKTFINGIWNWECPAEYHSAEDDETGQCYPNTEPCYPGQIMHPETLNCGEEKRLCEEFNMTGCLVEGRMLGTFPDEYCLTRPDNENCATNGFDCPDGFLVMQSTNFTINRCVPEDVEQLEIAERKRQVPDPNRCAPGYRLEVSQSVDIHRRGDNIGTCILID